MNLNELNTDCKIYASEDFIFLLANELLVKKMETTDIEIEIEEADKNMFHQQSEYIGIASWLYLQVNDQFLSNHLLIGTDAFHQFVDNYRLLMEYFKPLSSTSGNWSPISLLYRRSEDSILRFLVNFGTVDEIMTSTLSAFKLILQLGKKRSHPLKTVLKKVYVQSDGITYLRFENGGWQFVDPLQEETNSVSMEYLQNNDFRIKKPWIVLQKDNLRKHKITSSNWVLEFDGLQTLMLQPNDVSIYSSISDQNLKQAREFYTSNILPRHKYYHGNFPILEQQQEYFEYFQFIITAVIFAYTSIEAFANICIPDQHTFEEEKNGVKTIYSKMAIEAKFPLRDKFKKVLNVVLKTPDPSLEKWWGKFIELEKLRNEIIHTKQSDTAVRYSRLLSRSIFELIAVHKKVITYYGQYIAKNKSDLLDEFPYNFGNDSVVPGISTSPDYKHWIRIFTNFRSIIQRETES